MGLVHYTSAKAFLFDYGQEKDFDILRLDVEMPEIYTKFNEIVGDKTAIYISHRLSSCRFCDRIAVFEKGSIVQVARTRSCFVTGVANSMNSGMHKRSITRKRKY